MVLLTGATGFVGGHLARLLVGQGRRVRALVRPASERRWVADLDVEWIEGDLRDRASLDAAVRGCSRLYHVAADYRLWASDPSELYGSNVDGTRNILGAAAEAGMEKVVYTSTVGCIGLPAGGGPGDEDTPVREADMAGHYKRSKFLAEQAALEFAGRGLPVVIVNPTAPVGERDVKPTPTGKIIVDFLRGAMPAYLDTGLNLVDVRDVARGHLLAERRGRVGERYILGGQNLTLREILLVLARLAGRKAPRVRIPYTLAWLFAVAGESAAKLTGREPRASIEAVRMARKKMFVRGDKARREVGFQAGGVEDALRRAIEWFRANQYC